MSFQLSIPGVSLPVLEWLPDETVFSLVSRYHVISGNRTADQTCLQLFGHRLQGAQHDFPARVDELVSRTGGLLGDPEEVLRKRSILAYYLPFRSRQFAEQAITSLRTAGIGGLKYRLGLAASRFGANHPLKACPMCLDADRESHGVAYWHVSHQYPGVWVCVRHDCWLAEATVKSNGIERFLWHLPDEMRLQPHAAAGVPECSREVAKSRCTSIANLAIRISAAPKEFHLEPERLAATYRTRLAELGYVRGGQRLQAESIGRTYLAWVAPMVVLREYSALPRTLPEAHAQVVRLLHGSGAHTHPLRHLLFIAWMWGNWDAFLTDYGRQIDSIARSIKDDEAGKFGESPAQSTNEVRKCAVVALVRDSGISASAAANAVGVDPSTAMFWLAQADISVPRRPKLLSRERLAPLVASLRSGAEKQQVAAVHGVSLSTITRLLRTEIGLRDSWDEARRERRLHDARTEWTSTIEEHPGVGVKLLRELNPAAYAWLYRNDRQWLRDSCAKQPKAAAVFRSPVDWDSRDQALASAVRAASVQMSSSANGLRIAIRDLLLLVPELRTKMRTLERLPLTRQALEVVLTRRHDNQQSRLL